MADEYSYPYTPPPFLQGQSADQIHSRMLENLPADIDKSQGNIPWDFTRPSALEKAEFAESRTVAPTASKITLAVRFAGVANW